MSKENGNILDAHLSRRQLLKTAVVATAGVAGLSNPESIFATQNNSIEYTNSQNQPPTQTQEGEESHDDEHSEHKNSFWNDATSVIISSYFGGLVTGAALGKVNFGPTTAAASTALEIARYNILKATGDETAAQHDFDELLKPPFGAYWLLPLLVGVAETASHIRVQNDEIFKPEKVQALYHKVESERENIVEEPKNHDNLEEWEAFHEDRKEELIKIIAENAAVTTVLAPLGTTYTSASIAKESLKRVRGVLEEVHFSKKIKDTLRNKGLQANGINENEETEINMSPDEIEAFKKEAFDKSISPDEIEAFKKEAFDKSLSDINDRGGYLHLNIALAANTNGALGIGDPPNFYFMARHPELVPAANIIGGTFSESASAVMNYMWLADKVGIKDAKGFFGKFLSNEKKTIKKLMSTWTDGNLRDISFGGRRHADNIFKQIKEHQANSSNGAKIEPDKYPNFAYYVDLEKILKQKSDAIGQLLDTGKRKLPFMDKNGRHFLDKNYGERLSFDELIGFMEEFDVQNVLEQQDKSGLEILSKELRKIRLDETQSDITALIEELTHPSPSENGDKSTDAALNKLLNLPISPDGLGIPDVNKMLEDISKDTVEMHQLKIYANEVDALSLKYKDKSPKERHNGIRRLARVLNNREYAMDPSRFEELCGKLEDISTLRSRGAHADAVVEDLENFSSDIKGMVKNHEEEKLKEFYNLLGTIGPKDIQKPFEEALLLTKYGDQEHHATGLLGHESSEVLWVLSTQLPVVPALVHGVKRILPPLVGASEGEDTTLSQVKKMKSAVLGFEVATSAFADNVAAYLFAETVLNDIFSEYYGDEYNNKKGLKDTAALAALFTAISAGSLTKIGNGPTVTMAELDENEKFQSINFGKSLQNPYSIAQTMLVYLMSNHFISNKLK